MSAPPTLRVPWIGILLATVLLWRGANSLVWIADEVRQDIDWGRPANALAPLEERLRAALGPGYGAYRAAREQVPEDGLIVVLIRPEGPQARSFLACHALLFPRTVVLVTELDPSWRPAGPTAERPGYVLDIDSGQLEPFESFLESVERGEEFELWRVTGGGS